MELIFNETYCNTLLKIMADHIYETQTFVFFGKKMPKTYHSAQKMAKYYIKCLQLNVAIYTIVNTPFLENYIKSLQLLDLYGYVDFSEMTDSMNLEDVYASTLDELNGTIQKYKKELQSIQLKKVTFKEINKTCVQVKQIIKEFKEKREHLFQQCVQIIEALIEQQKLEKIINKIKELEAKKIIKINA
jgi:hypothetical protein